ncbi:hypothetical protein [Aquabacterium humicola]|uniref:hypothetical protein n=1 Tax=Aquabacterium humicola TaxID=3237377 RepID=UPI0025437989|nr:hypothetical protein [Rubrivivax pictus]
MSRKTAYQSPPRGSVSAAKTQPLKARGGTDDAWKFGEETEITAPVEERPMVQELWALLTEVRTAAFFVEPLEKRLPVVQRISQLHEVLLRSRAVKGYVGGTESRQARRLLESYGQKVKPHAHPAKA